MEKLSPPPARYVRITPVAFFTGTPMVIAGPLLSSTLKPAGILLAVLGVLVLVGGFVAAHLNRKYSPAEQAFRAELRTWLLRNYNLEASENILATLSHSLDDSYIVRDRDTAFQSFGIRVWIDEDLRLVTGGRKASARLMIQKSGSAALVLEGFYGMPYERSIRPLSQSVFAATSLIRL